MKLNLRRRDLILIGGFWLIGCALLVIVFYFAVQQEPELVTDNVLRPQATFTVVYNQVTARNSQEQALEYAKSRWQEDAQLMAVTSTWSKTELHAVGEPTSWTYRYYSPSTKRMFFVTISPDGNAIGTLHTERPYVTPPFISSEHWQVDSPEAISAWLNFGGSTMIAAMPGIQVVAQLQVKQPDSPPTWIVAGFDRASQNFLSVSIDANSREVLTMNTSLR
ncbi:MAG: hypothetical protein AAF629_11910 [Chloroflexota bacterium]